MAYIHFISILQPSRYVKTNYWLLGFNEIEIKMQSNDLPSSLSHVLWKSSCTWDNYSEVEKTWNTQGISWAFREILHR